VAAVALAIALVYLPGSDLAVARVEQRGDATEVGLAARRLYEQQERVVEVLAFGCDGVSVGSGLLVGNDEVLTNRHVVAGAWYTEVRRSDGVRVGARVERVGADIDLAVLWIGDAGAVGVQPAGTLVPGASIWVVGHPHGGPLTVSPGHVEARTPVDVPNMHVVAAYADTAVDQGSSGGAAFDRSGRVVGIVFGREQHTGSALILDADMAAHFLAGDYLDGDPTACDDS
jgi:hypothetical protein